MKKFLLRLIIFAVILLTTSALLDFFISNRLKKSIHRANGEYGVWNDIYEGKVNSDMVVYGSSRAWVHFDPKMLENAFHVSTYNLGIDGHNFSLQKLRHKELLRFNKRPKIIILSVDIFSFTKYAQLFNVEQFIPYMLFNRRVQQVFLKYNEYSIADFFVPLIRYRGKREQIENAFEASPSKQNSLRIKGYSGIDEQWNDDFARVKKSRPYYSIQTDSSILVEFEAFLQECMLTNTKLIMVYSPEYIDGQKFVSNRQDLLRLYSTLAKKYHVPFYDYSNNSISYQKKYFYNTQHLNKQGAEVFTKVFIRDLKKDSQLIEVLIHKNVN